MWLLVDIGNSAVKVGLFDQTAAPLGAAERGAAERGAAGMAATQTGTAERGAAGMAATQTGAVGRGELVAVRRIEFSSDIEAQLKEFVAGAAIQQVGAVSVVPAQTNVWTDLVNRVLGLEITFFDEQSVLPFQLTYQTPRTLGNDRIAVAVGGWTRFGRPGESGVIVVDAGTAITYELITREGQYPGGVIAPGPDVQRRSLAAGTAQLPPVDLTQPSSRIGRTTDEAIRSGIMFGFSDSVRAMVDGIQAEQTYPCEVVLTGGWGAWLAERTGYRYEPDLVLKGVADLIRYQQ